MKYGTIDAQIFRSNAFTEKEARGVVSEETNAKANEAEMRNALENTTLWLPQLP